MNKVISFGDNKVTLTCLTKFKLTAFLKNEKLFTLLYSISLRVHLHY